MHAGASEIGASVTSALAEAAVAFASLESGRGAQRLHDALVQPAGKLTERSGKCFRGRLVQLGFSLAGPADGVRAGADKALRLAAAIELVHAGSLIVDDIQDGSAVRRGGPSLHRLVGMPSALCVGNWLYFFPLTLCRGLDLDERQELALYRRYHEALELAHRGQALDVATRVDAMPRSDVAFVSRQIAELKSGALIGLAMAAGGVARGADVATCDALARFGRRYGTALQALDDAGNLLGVGEPAKRYEDVITRRPCAPWAFAADDDDVWRDLSVAVDQLPDSTVALERWLASTDFARHNGAAVRKEIDGAMSELREALGRDGQEDPAWSDLRALGDELIDAYGRH